MDNSLDAKKKVLVIEDEEYLRDLYVEILCQEGYEVDMASDGEQGYVAMQKGGYDLVLLDIMLPRMDGFQILEKLRITPPSRPNLSVIILTNLGKEVNVAKGLSLGVSGYLIKTETTPDQIIQEVKGYLK